MSNFNGQIALMNRARLLQSTLALISSALATPDVRLLTTTYLANGDESQQFITLEVDRKTAKHITANLTALTPEEINADGGMYHRYPLALEGLGGIKLKERWRLSGEQTNVVCTVTGFEMVASPYAQAGASLENAGAPCGATLYIARVGCDSDALSVRLRGCWTSKETATWRSWSGPRVSRASAHSAVKFAPATTRSGVSVAAEAG